MNDSQRIEKGQKVVRVSGDYVVGRVGEIVHILENNRHSRRRPVHRGHAQPSQHPSQSEPDAANETGLNYFQIIFKLFSK